MFVYNRYLITFQENKSTTRNITQDGFLCSKPLYQEHGFRKISNKEAVLPVVWCWVCCGWFKTRKSTYMTLCANLSEETIWHGQTHRHEPTFRRYLHHKGKTPHPHGKSSSRFYSDTMQVKPWRVGGAKYSADHWFAKHSCQRIVLTCRCFVQSLWTCH